MYDTEGNKRICILDNLFDFQQPHQYIHLKERKRNHTIKIQKKLPRTENVRIKYLIYFKHQINIIVFNIIDFFPVEASF